jgi:integration host factor subunit beta
MPSARFKRGIPSEHTYEDAHELWSGEKRMTRADLIEHLCQQRQISKKAATLIVEEIFDGMTKALRRGERIELRGFGSFEVRQYQTFWGRHPRTGEPLEIEARRLACFRVSREMIERLNGQQPGVRLVHTGPGKPRKKSMSITGVWQAYQDEEVPDSDEITRKMG